MAAYTKGAKRRAKKAALPGLANTPKRKARGRKRMEQIKREKEFDPEAERTVLQARARQAGKTPKDLTEMRHTAYGEDAGRAIYARHEGDTAKRLWDTYSALSGAYRRYLRTCIGASVDAKTAKIEMMPERFETSASDTPDMRSEEDRHRAALNAWTGWKIALDRLPLGKSAAIYSALHGWGALMDGGEITGQGRRFVVAMGFLDQTAGTR
jgi:hypothetical protein